MSEEKGFEVRDKRKVRADAEVSPGSPEATAQKEDAGAKEKSGTEGQAGLPAIDFMSFVGSLAATALMHMGEKFSPEQPDSPKDLQAAKQMIDLIDLLKAKTAGNLDAEESAMMDNLLYNLKLRYVRETTGK